MKTIDLPVVRWALGDPEQSTTSGVTTVVRPLYYQPKPKGGLKMVRVGSINPDYAGPLMAVLSKEK